LAFGQRLPIWCCFPLNGRKGAIHRRDSGRDPEHGLSDLSKRSLMGSSFGVDEWGISTKGSLTRTLACREI
jgi:hypothetical protein